MKIAVISSGPTLNDNVEAFLREQARVMEEQKDEVEQKIRVLETGQNLVAVVLPEKCAGYGICADVCPVNAIEVDEHTVINTVVCTGCGACISECPNEAIILTQDKNH